MVAGDILGPLGQRRVQGTALLITEIANQVTMRLPPGQCPPSERELLEPGRAAAW